MSVAENIYCHDTEVWPLGFITSHHRSSAWCQLQSSREGQSLSVELSASDMADAGATYRLQAGKERRESTSEEGKEKGSKEERERRGVEERRGRKEGKVGRT